MAGQRIERPLGLGVVGADLGAGLGHGRAEYLRLSITCIGLVHLRLIRRLPGPVVFHELPNQHARDALDSDERRFPWGRSLADLASVYTAVSSRRQRRRSWF